MDCRVMAKQHIFRPGIHFRHAHASTLLRLEDGSVLIAYFAGTAEKHVDVGIWCSIGRGGVFAPPKCVFRDTRWPCWNPVLHLDRNGVVFLYCKVGPSPERWWTMVLESRDNGESFGEARVLVPEDEIGRGPVKNKLVEISARHWVAGASVEKEKNWEAFSDSTKDGGCTWTRSDPVMAAGGHSGLGVIQPALWQSGNGKLHMFLRSDVGCLYRCDSEDEGTTWSSATPTDIPNNNSGIDVAYMENGILALLMNDTSENWGMRTPLVLMLSRDNGRTWPGRVVIEHNEKPIDRRDGEFSYPAVIAWADHLWISYTWKRRTIEFVDVLVLT